MKISLFVALYVASVSALAHFDYDIEQPSHIYRHWSNSAVWADTPEEACRMWVEDIRSYIEPNAYPDGLSSNGYYARWKCTYRFHQSDPNTHETWIHERHCDYHLSGTGSTCTYTGETYCSLFHGLYTDNYVDSSLSSEPNVNINMCSMSQAAVDSAKAYNWGAWNGVVQECEDKGEYFCLVTSTYSGSGDSDSGGCDNIGMFFTGGTEHDYISDPSSPAVRVSINKQQNSCNPGVYELECGVDDGPAIGFWSFPLADAGIPDIELDTQPDSWCLDSCRHVNPLADEIYQDIFCGADTETDTKMECFVDIYTNGETCLAASGNYGTEDGGDIPTGGTDDGGTDGGSNDGGSTDDGGSGGGGLDDSNIVAGLDGVRSDLEGIDGKLDGIADGVAGINDAINGEFDGTVPEGSPYDDLTGEIDQARDGLVSAINNFTSSFGSVSDISLGTATYECDGGITVNNINIQLCLSPDNIQQLNFIGQAVMVIAAFAAAGVVFRM